MQTGRDISLQHHTQHDCMNNIDHGSQAKIGIHPFPARLAVMTLLQNPWRWRSRYKNYWAFQKHVEDSGGVLFTAEIAFGERHFEVTEAGNPFHLQIRAQQEPWHQELWQKESILNLLATRIPIDMKYIAWVDCDVHFTKPDWCQETMHLLQHYRFLQLFSHAQDLGPNEEPLIASPGFVAHRVNTPDAPITGVPTYYGGDGYGYYGGKGLWIHPGFAWAARREALNHVGGLVDWAILGSGDWIMGAALFGEVKKAVGYGGYHPTYTRWAYNWQNRAEQYIRRNVGYLPGLVLHRYHGKKIDRKYDTRWKLLADTQFNPETDLKKDVQGMLTLVDDGSNRILKLRDGIRRYALLRNEDTTEV